MSGRFVRAKVSNDLREKITKEFRPLSYESNEEKYLKVGLNQYAFGSTFSDSQVDLDSINTPMIKGEYENVIDIISNMNSTQIGYDLACRHIQCLIKLNKPFSDELEKYTNAGVLQVSDNSALQAYKYYIGEEFERCLSVLQQVDLTQEHSSYYQKMLILALCALDKKQEALSLLSKLDTYSFGATHIKLLLFGHYEMIEELSNELQRCEITTSNMEYKLIQDKKIEFFYKIVEVLQFLTRDTSAQDKWVYRLNKKASYQDINDLLNSALDLCLRDDQTCYADERSLLLMKSYILAGLVQYSRELEICEKLGFNDPQIVERAIVLNIRMKDNEKVQALLDKLTGDKQKEFTYLYRWLSNDYIDKNTFLLEWRSFVLSLKFQDYPEAWDCFDAATHNSDLCLDMANAEVMNHDEITLAVKLNMYLRRGQVENAAKLAELWSSSHPMRRMNTIFGALYMNNGYYKEAIEQYFDYVDMLYEEHFAVIDRACRCLLKLDKPHEAHDHLLLWKNSNRNNTDLAKSNQLEYNILFHMGGFDDRLYEASCRLLKQTMDNPTLILNHATILLRTGRLDELKTYTAKIIEEQLYEGWSVHRKVELAHMIYLSELNHRVLIEFLYNLTVDDFNTIEDMALSYNVYMMYMMERELVVAGSDVVLVQDDEVFEHYPLGEFEDVSFDGLNKGDKITIKDKDYIYIGRMDMFEAHMYKIGRLLINKYPEHSQIHSMPKSIFIQQQLKHFESSIKSWNMGPHTLASIGKNWSVNHSNALVMYLFNRNIFVYSLDTMIVDDFPDIDLETIPDNIVFTAQSLLLIGFMDTYWVVELLQRVYGLNLCILEEVRIELESIMLNPHRKLILSPEGWKKLLSFISQFETVKEAESSKYITISESGKKPSANGLQIPLADFVFVTSEEYDFDDLTKQRLMKWYCALYELDMPLRVISLSLIQELLRSQNLERYHYYATRAFSLLMVKTHPDTSDLVKFLVRKYALDTILTSLVATEIKELLSGGDLKNARKTTHVFMQTLTTPFKTSLRDLYFETHFPNYWISYDNGYYEPSHYQIVKRLEKYLLSKEFYALARKSILYIRVRLVELYRMYRPLVVNTFRGERENRPYTVQVKRSRNVLCWCGSGRSYKGCCLIKHGAGRKHFNHIHLPKKKSEDKYNLFSQQQLFPPIIREHLFKPNRKLRTIRRNKVSSKRK